jgi:hypothetical protein
MMGLEPAGVSVRPLAGSLFLSHHYHHDKQIHTRGCSRAEAHHCSLAAGGGGKNRPLASAQTTSTHYVENPPSILAGFSNSLTAKSKSCCSRPMSAARYVDWLVAWRAQHDPFGIQCQPSRRKAVPAMWNDDATSVHDREVRAPSGGASLQMSKLPFRGRRGDRARRTPVARN